MKKIKAKPIVLTQALHAKSVSTNLTIVLDAQIELANQINESIAAFNTGVALLPKQIDEEAIKKELEIVKANFKDINLKNKTMVLSEHFEKEILTLKKSIPSSFDDSILMKEVKEIKKSIPKQFDPAALNEAVKKLKESQPKDNAAEVQELKEAVKSLSEKLNGKNIEDEDKVSTLIKQVATLQQELRTARKTLGSSIDEVRIATEKLTEVK